MSYVIPNLPLNVELESKPILKKLAKAHQALAELKGSRNSSLWTRRLCNHAKNVLTTSLEEAVTKPCIEMYRF